MPLVGALHCLETESRFPLPIQASANRQLANPPHRQVLTSPWFRDRDAASQDMMARLALMYKRLLRWPVFVASTLSLLSIWFLYRRHSPARPQLHDFRGDKLLESLSLNKLEVIGDFDENAHLLPDAEAFLPHFKALLARSNMTTQEANETCHWNSEEASLYNFGMAANHEWTLHNPPEEEVDLHRGLWQNFVATAMIPYSVHKKRFKGRGIVIIAGNEYTFTRTLVVLRALNKHKSTLPVEIHYWADEMKPGAQERILEVYPNTFFNDLSTAANIVIPLKMQYLNYQFKTAALVNSRFEEILLLDPDNIPVIDPQELFESPLFKQYGTIFWPDVTRTRPNNPAWGITNTACRENEFEQESGQLLVDKRRFFYHLQLAAWWSSVYGFYWTSILLGDKDIFRFAWHALKTRFGFPPKWLASVGKLHDDFYCGHSFAQHHPDGRVAFMHGGFLKTLSKEVLKWYRDHEDNGVYQVYQRSPYDENHQVNEIVDFYFDGNFWLPDRPADMRGAFCLKLHGVEYRPLDEIVPGFSKFFEEIGGYWLVDEKPIEPLL